MSWLHQAQISEREMLRRRVNSDTKTIHRLTKMIGDTPDKKRWPLEVATVLALGFVGELEPLCDRVCIAGSIRREKPMVGDIEILYIPQTGTRDVPGDMFARETVNLVDAWLNFNMAAGQLAKRPNAIGNYSYGPKIKLMIHTPTGIPIDFFSTTEESWWNYLVCRTGSAETNKRIAERAQGMRQTWQPYSSGFMRTIEGAEPGAADHETVPMHSEREVFAHVGLPYLEPKDR